MPPVRIGIIGMGGFAGSHHTAVAKLEEQGHAKLICTCDPLPARFTAEQQTWKFAQRNVSIFGDYRAMLEACHRNLDLVVIPTPIQMHAEMHAACTTLGVPAYLEKPPTLDHVELERMILNDTRSPKASLVGFNFIIEKQRLALKDRLRAGEFGALRGTTLSALWPRPASYFERNNWAGRLLVEDRVVLDSCFGNAMGHFVHNMLFWAGGPDLMSWAQLSVVRAELYRAHAIQGADTFFVEADTTLGITMRFALSHACAGASSQRETILCDKAVIRYSVGNHAEVRWLDGRTEKTSLEPLDPLGENHLDYFQYLRGKKNRPATTLVDSRPFVALNNLAYISSRRITQIPPALITSVRDEKEQKDYLNVASMPAAQENFLARGEWPGAHGWQRAPGDAVTPGDITRFHEIVRAMTVR